MEERNKKWGEIGRLKNGNILIYNIKTKKISIEEYHKYARNPHPEEKQEILKIINESLKKIKRWQKIIELIQKKL